MCREEGVRVRKNGKERLLREKRKADSQPPLPPLPTPIYPQRPGSREKKKNWTLAGQHAPSLPATLAASLSVDTRCLPEMSV